MNTKRKMFIKLLFSSLLRRRSRLFIALLSVVIGATILSGLLTIYYDVPRQMSSEFRNYGANVILSSSEYSLTQNDIDKALSYIPNKDIEGYTPYRYENTEVKHDRLTVAVTMAGTNFDSINKTSPYWAVEGRLPETKNEVILGGKVASTFSKKVGHTLTLQNLNVEINDDIRPLLDSDDFTYTIDGVEYVDRQLDLDIVGILQTGGKEEEYIYLNLDDVSYITFTSRDYDLVELSIAATNADLNKYINNINSANLGFSAKLIKRVTASEATVLTKLQSLVFIVTFVVLVLTMICVATTMAAVVAERRKEIGLRKSLGASNKNIAGEFILEGVVIGSVAGIFGAILGYLFALIISINVFSSAITFRPLLIPLTIVASIIVTTISSLIPVRTAVKVEPALVLKGE